MSKLPKFMLASNPMASPNSMFILHARKPFFLAEVLTNIDDDINIRFTVNGVKYGLKIAENFNNSNKLEIPEGLLNRLFDWVHAYIKFSEK